ncbi:MAG: cation transporter [Oscillospiraceae bacterium]|jgi:copper chaperone CopZ|nr:cation transporter [Oscillospiraceae bacterium]
MKDRIVLSVKGMSCGHCVASVEKVLQSLGCEDINVSISEEKAEFTATRGFAEKAANAINAIGFEASAI